MICLCEGCIKTAGAFGAFPSYILKMVSETKAETILLVPGEGVLSVHDGVWCSVVTCMLM